MGLVFLWIMIFFSSALIVQSFRVQIIRSVPRTYLSSSNNLDRELDLFFENAARSGFADVKKMTIEERVERVNLGELLEDKIFEARDEILRLGKWDFAY